MWWREMAQVVQAGRGELDQGRCQGLAGAAAPPGFARLVVVADRAAHQLGHRVRVQLPAVLPGEHVVASVLPCRTQPSLLFVLSQAVLEKHCDGLWVNADGARPT